MNICPNCRYRSVEKTCPRDGFPMVSEALVRASSSEADFVGKVFENRYEVESLLGRGGMGWVFKARHRTMQHAVALKVLRRDLGEDLNAIKRFYQEARACSLLTHPHTIKVHDFGMSEEGYLYLAMEFLQGVPLSQAIQAGPLAPERAGNIARAICQSLDEAHERGMVHRDLKPANIFLCELHRLADWVKVLDFGIAKFVDGNGSDETLTKSGMLVGTPKYVSPEQAQARPLDRRSDLYSLGIILFEMLTGKAPFVAQSSGELVVMHVSTAPPPLPAVVQGRPIPAALRQLVVQLLEKQPAARPASAAEVDNRLAEIVGFPTPGDAPVRPAPAVGVPAAVRPAAAPAVAAAAQPAALAQPGPAPAAQAGAAVPPARHTPTRAAAPPGTAALGVAADAPAPAANPRRRLWLIAGLLFAALGGCLVVLLLTLPEDGASGLGDGTPDALAGGAAATAGNDVAQLAPGPADPPSDAGPTQHADTHAAPLRQSGTRAADAVTAPDQGRGAHTAPASPPASADVRAAAAAPAALTATAAPAPAAAPPTEVRVRIESLPPGATVLEAGRDLGRTPLDLDVAPAAARNLTLRRSGYRPESHTLRAADAPTWRVALRPVAAERPAPAAPREPPAGYRVPFPSIPGAPQTSPEGT